MSSTSVLWLGLIYIVSSDISCFMVFSVTSDHMSVDVEQTFYGKMDKLYCGYFGLSRVIWFLVGQP